MTAQLNPYIGFRDNASEAIDYYQSVFGGELTKSTFAEYQVSQDPAEGDKIMHAQLTSPSGFTLMASDTPNGMDRPDASNISISLSGGPDDEQELRGYYEKLSDGGTVTMPLEKAPWGDFFGMCMDRYGVNWLVNITGA